jgi:hypothetical protein
MARIAGGIRGGSVVIVRQAASIIVADSATLTDANIDPTLGFSSKEYDSVLLSVEITAGTNPTMTLEMLLGDAEAADGARWKRIALAKRFGGDDAANQALVVDSTKFIEFVTFGAELIFPRVTAVANPTSTTAWKILALPGARRGALT